jgi:hypothetical protein
MFASMRRYRMHRGSMDELAGRVDAGFAEEICAQPGFVSYEFVDCGDGEVMTISIFGEEKGAAGSRELAQRWTAEHLQDLEFTRLGAVDGEILVSRARDDILEPGPSAPPASSRAFVGMRYEMDRSRR